MKGIIFTEFLDFIEAENSMGFHAPQEAARILGQSIDFSTPFRRLTMYEALREIGGQHVEGVSDEDLRSRVRALGVRDVEGMGRGKLIDELFGELVEPKLIQPTFITDYPREMSPLAKPKRGDAALTERFELIVAGKEVVNAYSELNDPFDQRERFEAQVRLLAAGDDEVGRLANAFGAMVAKIRTMIVELELPGLERTP